MLWLLEIVVSIAVLYVSYVWYKKFQTRDKLKWIVEVPGWPIIGNILEFSVTSESLNDLSRLIKTYGKIYKISILNQIGVITTDYDFLEFILGTQNILNKSVEYSLLHGWLGTGLLTSDGPKWKKRRRMETPAFHFSILEQFLDYFESNGKILINQLKEEVGKDSFDVYPYVTLYALDIISETAMGVSINAQINKDSEYVRNVKEMLRTFSERNLSLYKRFDLLYKLSEDYYIQKRAIKQLHGVTYSVIDARRKELEKVKDGNDHGRDELGRKKKMAFLDILLRATIDGKPLSREDIREEVDTFMFEGHDTTAAAMSFASFLLANHPEVQERAFQEQKEMFGDDNDRSPSYNDLQSMKYLEQVIKESLRLYPSVPLIGRTPDHDVEYKGNILPKGIRINAFIYGVLRDPDNFSDPDKFDPDRFEHNDGTRPFSFIPFSAGPRNCIGQKFAMLEIKSFLSKMLRNFELLPATPEHKLILAAEAVLKSQNGVNIKIRKRKW